MKLEGLTVNIRPIDVYHAIDLGLAMARTWYGELWRLSFFVLRFVFWLFLLVFVFFAQSDKTMSGYVLLLMMASFSLVRAYAEVYAMVLISQKVFDETAQTDEAMAMFASNIKKNRLPLLLKSFLPKRVMMMAVYILEGQQGKAAKHRLSVLNRGIGTGLMALAAVFVLLELVLFFVGLILFDLVLTSPYDYTSIFESIFLSETIPLWLSAWILGWYVLVVLTLLPFFVGASFAVYLCRRSMLEAWDVELSFRKMAGRFEELHHTQLKSQKQSTEHL